MTNASECTGIGEAFWVRDRVVPTLMWGRAGRGFGSRVDLANYYSLLDPARCSRAIAMVDLVSSDGVLVGSHTSELGPREQLHLDISDLQADFEGTIAVRLLPDVPPDHHHRYVGTLYFVTWFDAHGHVQFSHEQNRMSFDREQPRTFLSPGLELRSTIDIDVILQSSYFGDSDRDAQDVEVSVLDHRGRTISSATLALPPAGSRRLSLADLCQLTSGTVAVRVTGPNLNHPFTYIRHASGDFNIHHF